MSLKRNTLLAILAAAGILISAAVAWKLVVRSDRHRLPYLQYGPAISQNGPHSKPQKSGKTQYPTSPQQEHAKAFDAPIVQKRSPSAAPAPLNASIIASEEEAQYFEMMTAALAEDFPELDLTEMERIVGMNFDEFMLRTSSAEGGIDRQ
jgi:hypothetical protein